MTRKKGQIVMKIKQTLKIQRSKTKREFSNGISASEGNFCFSIFSKILFTREVQSVVLFYDNRFDRHN